MHAQRVEGGLIKWMVVGMVCDWLIDKVNGEWFRVDRVDGKKMGGGWWVNVG